MTYQSRQVHLVARPTGRLGLECFDVVSAHVNEPATGQIVVRNHWMSVDPYMRARMDDRQSYVAPYALGEPLDGGAVGEVLASGDPRFDVGDIVRHRQGWREVALVAADDATSLGELGAPEQAYLGILGMPGLTAYAGLCRVAQIQPGDVLFVSAAAGAVGSAVGQMAKLLGAATVIGSAGGEAKTRHIVEDLGFDAAIDYKAGPIHERLAELAPDGIDIYFDNVGGEQLEAALDLLRLHGRVVVCGVVSQTNSDEVPQGPRNWRQIIVTRAIVSGILSLDHLDLEEEFRAEVTAWVSSGKLKYEETIRDGIENAPQALLDLLAGQNTGKMLVRLC